MADDGAGARSQRMIHCHMHPRASSQGVSKLKASIAQRNLGFDHINSRWREGRPSPDSVSKRREGSDPTASNKRLEDLSEDGLDHLVDAEPGNQLQCLIVRAQP